MSPTPDLDRFSLAQDRVYANVLAELTFGRKTSHWMWYIFPQIVGLGHSSTSREFAIMDLDEARRYLDHAILGPRLLECVELVLAVRDRTAENIFGVIDARKLRSSATLFAEVSSPGSVFHRLLDQFFDKRRDQATIDILEKQRVQTDRES